MLEQLPLSDPDRELRIAVHCLAHDLEMSDELIVAAARQAVDAVDPVLARDLIARVAQPTWDSQFVLGARSPSAGTSTPRTSARRSDRTGSPTSNTLAPPADVPTASERRRPVRRCDRGHRRGATITVTDPHWRAFVDADRAYLQLALGLPTDTAISASDATGAARANECLVGAVIAALAGRGAETEALVEEGLSLAHLLVADVPTRANC